MTNLNGPSELANRMERVAFISSLVSQAYTSQVDYGRWVLASLLTIEGGALFLIAQTGDVLSKKLFIASGPFLLSGLVAVMLTGILGWLNFTVAAGGYAQALVSLLNNSPKEPSKSRALLAIVTMYAGAGFGLVSILCFILAGWRGYWTIING